MDIAALSISLNQMKVQQQAGTKVLKMAMDNAHNQASEMNKLLDTTMPTGEKGLQPHLGTILDLYV